MIIHQNYIAGQFNPPIGGIYLDNFNPATGETSGRIPDSGPEDVEAAVRAAQAAFPAWANLSLDNRHDILRGIADGILAKPRPAWPKRKVWIPAKPSPPPARSTSRGLPKISSFSPRPCCISPPKATTRPAR
jgi:hypothetical protein